MLTGPIKILGIDPGTREIGFAILSDGELLHFGVKTISKRSSPKVVLRAARQIIARLIVDYGIEYLAIKQRRKVQENDVLAIRVMKEIKATAKRCRLLIYDYAGIVLFLSSRLA